MPTDIKTPEQLSASSNPSLSMRDLASVLVKHYGLTEGTYDLVVEFQIGTGAVGPDKDNLVPGAMIGVSRVGLVPTTEQGPNTVDAALLNPTKKPRKKTTT
ncbi:MAG: hypothetical protein Q7T94_04805 [Rugosibacter sp.]|nr:hypothetical protein [Rugosibacter sp.]